MSDFVWGHPGLCIKRSGTQRLISRTEELIQRTEIVQSVIKKDFRQINLRTVQSGFGLVNVKVSKFYLDQ